MFWHVCTCGYVHMEAQRQLQVLFFSCLRLGRLSGPRAPEILLTLLLQHRPPFVCLDTGPALRSACVYSKLITD